MDTHKEDHECTGNRFPIRIRFRSEMQGKCIPQLSEGQFVVTGVSKGWKF